MVCGRRAPPLCRPVSDGPFSRNRQCYCALRTRREENTHPHGRVGKDADRCRLQDTPCRGFPVRVSRPACHAAPCPSPSSHRTGGFPASGVPRYLCQRHAPGVDGPERPVGAWLGRLAQRLSQKRVCRRQVPRVRSRNRFQAALPFSYSSTYLAGPLRSTAITPLPRYYEPRRLPTRAVRQVMDSLTPLDTASTRSGLPGSWQIGGTRAVPNHPGEPNRCSCPLLPCWWQASPGFGRLATLKLHNEAESGSRYYRPRTRLARLRTLDYSKARSLGFCVERAIDKGKSFQLARSAKLRLAHQSMQSTKHFPPIYIIITAEI
jgi:hypothetical protein